MYLYLWVCFFIILLDSFLNISLQPSGFGQNTVAQRQNVICSVSGPSDVDPDTIELGWLYKDDIITDDSRVTINTSSDYYNDSSLVTIIQFDPLFEDDEGEEYICYTITNGSLVYKSINLQHFTSKLFHTMYARTYVHTYID